MPAPVITPPLGYELASAYLVGFSADQSVTWSANAGALSNVTATTVDYLPPNVTGVYLVTATNGASQATAAPVSVIGNYPTSPDFNVEGEVDKRVIVSVAEDGTRQTRTKRAMKRQYDLVHSRRTKAEFVLVEQFWDAHYPGKHFYFADPVRGIQFLAYFVSKLRHRPGSFDSYDFEVTILEK